MTSYVFTLVSLHSKGRSAVEVCSGDFGMLVSLIEMGEIGTATRTLNGSINSLSPRNICIRSKDVRYNVYVGFLSKLPL